MIDLTIDLIKKISNEHKSLFPMADLDSQEQKLIEELDEVIQELVDMLIVSAGIYRFDHKKALKIVKKVIRVCKILGVDLDVVKAEVNRKWQINLKRKWEWNGKTYHHIGGDE